MCAVSEGRDGGQPKNPARMLGNFSFDGSRSSPKTMTVLTSSNQSPCYQTGTKSNYASFGLPGALLQTGVSSFSPPEIFGTGNSDVHWFLHFR